MFYFPFAKILIKKRPVKSVFSNLTLGYFCFFIFEKITVKVII